MGRVTPPLQYKEKEKMKKKQINKLEEELNEASFLFSYFEKRGDYKLKAINAGVFNGLRIAIDIMNYRVVDTGKIENEGVTYRSFCVKRK